METCRKGNGGQGTGNKQAPGTQEGHRFKLGGTGAHLPILGCALRVLPSPPTEPRSSARPVATHLSLRVSPPPPPQRGEGCSYTMCIAIYGLQNALLFISPLYSHNTINETSGLSGRLLKS